MRVFGFLLGVALVGASCFAQGPAVERIKPSEADARVANYDEANVIVRPAVMTGAPLLVFLPGTTGRPENLIALMQVAAGQGYRAIALEYNDVPAVSTVCQRRADVDCAAEFRAMRVFGEKPASGRVAPVSNAENEAIVPRLVALLRALQKRHPAEGWDLFVTPQGKPAWGKIAVGGQSQGAGMAAFLAKCEKVARVICFSSPMDLASGAREMKFAPWIATASATPMERWYAVRNSREPLNKFLEKSYPALGIPADHVRVFAKDLPAGTDAGNPMAYHVVNIRDARYLEDWKFLFGDAAAVAR